MTLRLNGSTSGYVEVDSQAVGGNNTIQLPSSNGSANQFLKNGSTAGTLGWSSLVEDSSGRLLVGTSSSITSGTDTKLEIIQSNAGSSAWVLIGSADTAPVNGDGIGLLRFYGRAGGTWEEAARIEARYDATPGSGDKPTRLAFSVTPDGSASTVERMRISNDGESNMYGQGSVLNCRTASTSSTADVLLVRNGASSTTTGTIKFSVKGDGDCENTNNSYGALSDIKLKENIADANSQWSDIKALQVRKYNFKPETGHSTHTQIGLIAQEVELVSPGLVGETPDRDEDGNDLDTVTKSVNYSVLYMKAVKALQEAMERIETLEASNADLAARLSALEANS